MNVNWVISFLRLDISAMEILNVEKKNSGG